jgi:hypothetical protein
MQAEAARGHDHDLPAVRAGDALYQQLQGEGLLADEEQLPAGCLDRRCGGPSDHSGTEPEIGQSRFVLLLEPGHFVEHPDALVEAVALDAGHLPLELRQLRVDDRHVAGERHA